MTSDEVTELHNDLMRRAKACDNLAAPPVYPPDAVRSKGRADAFRHAAELLLASPLAAEVARLTAERDAAHAARVRAEAEADGLRRDLAAVVAERDLYRAALADAARGEAARCDTHYGGTLATQVHADGDAACDACAKGDGWTDTPHAAAIRGALKATEGER